MKWNIKYSDTSIKQHLFASAKWWYLETTPRFSPPLPPMLAPHTFPTHPFFGFPTPVAAHFHCDSWGLWSTPGRIHGTNGILYIYRLPFWLDLCVGFLNAMVNIPSNPYMDDMGPKKKTSNGRPVIQRISETREMPCVASQVCASYWWVAD